MLVTVPNFRSATFLDLTYQRKLFCREVENFYEFFVMMNNPEERRIQNNLRHSKFFSAIYDVPPYFR